MIVYISGPITGRLNGNRAAFTEAERLLKAAGHEVLNPFRLTEDVPPNAPWEDFMRVDLMGLLTADMVLALPGWRESKGAGIECRLAKDLGILVVEKVDWESLPVPAGARD
jgi:hypothetical protein